MRLEPLYYRVISEKRSLRYLPLYLLLRAVSIFYSITQTVRVRFYRWGVFRTRRLNCRVISVGNLTLGGTGKTPTVMMIAERLAKNGFKPVILSRGYGGSTLEDIDVVCDGKQILLSPETAGDEPVMMARRLQSVPVIVGRNRYRTGRYAMEHFGADVLILDDGYQHLALHRDLNILLCDAGHPFGNAVVFPAGDLREPVSATGRADLICLTRCSPDADESGIALPDETPIIKTRMKLQSVVDLKTGEELDPEYLRQQPVAAFCAIARPQSFFTLLENISVKLVDQLSFPDHQEYSTEQLQAIEKKAVQSGAKYILTTEKDAVKIAAGIFSMPVYKVLIDMEVIEGEEKFMRLLLSPSGER